MTTKKTLLISARIITFFIAAMAYSFIPDYLHDLFGDWHCNGGSSSYASIGPNILKGCQYGNIESNSHHGPTWHWGYRHWLFLLMGVSLSVVQIVNMITFIDKK